MELNCNGVDYLLFLLNMYFIDPRVSTMRQRRIARGRHWEHALDVLDPQGVEPGHALVVA